jgi:NADH-quinone oxidoreductase subunit N
LTTQDIYLLSPELSLVALAALVIIVDLVVVKKTVLAGISLVGLVVPLGFTLSLIGRDEMGFGGVLLVDDFSILFKCVFLGVGALVILSSINYLQQWSKYQGEYYGLVLFSLAGMMLMAATGELIAVYVALELTSISLYILAGFIKDPKSSEAGLKYLLLGAISSAVLLYGMALIFGLTGSTSLSGIAKALGGTGGTNYDVLLLGTVLMVAGFGFKIAAVPFQMWVPDVYEGAPTPVTAFLAVGSKAAGFALVLRVFYAALGEPPLQWDWAILFAILSAATMTIGNVVALVQTNIKRMLGYSSIAHAGYLLVGVATITKFGVSGVVFYLLAYAVTNLAAFGAIIAISNRTNSDEISSYSGMARRAPLVAFVLLISLLSLTGIPPTAGFFGKFYMFAAAVEYGLGWLVAIAVVNSAISAYYYVRVIKVMYLGAPESEERVITSASLASVLAVALAGIVFLGFYPAPLFEVVQTAAGVLFR